MNARRSIFAGLALQAACLAVTSSGIVGIGSIWIIRYSLESSAKADIVYEQAILPLSDSLLARHEASIKSTFEKRDLPARIYAYADQNGDLTSTLTGTARWPITTPLAPGWVRFNGTSMGKQGGRYIGLVYEFSKDDPTLDVVFIGEDHPQLKSYLLIARRIDVPSNALIAIFAFAALTGLSVGGLSSWLMRARITRIQSRVDGMRGAIADFWRAPLEEKRESTAGKYNDEIAQLDADIRTMMDRIGALIRSLDETSERVAHEVKDDLERLKRKLDPAQDQLAIKRIGSTQRMVGDILEMVRLEVGSDSEFEEFSVGSAIDQAVELYRDAFEDAGVSLSVLNDIDASVRGRRTLIVRALADLLNNALRYTPSGGTVEIQTQRSDGTFAIEVSDTGGGAPTIDIDDLSRLSRATMSEETSGSGLRFTRAVMKRHGGSIVLSNLETGLKVSLCFPIIQAAKERAT